MGCKEFEDVAEKAKEIAYACPLATKTDTNGKTLIVPLYLNDTWGLIYTTGQSAKVHNHWPSLWSYTYCVSACENCSPLMFPNAKEPLSVTPKTSQIIVFPSWLQHMVYPFKGEGERRTVASNLNCWDVTEQSIEKGEENGNVN